MTDPTPSDGMDLAGELRSYLIDEFWNHYRLAHRTPRSAEQKLAAEETFWAWEEMDEAAIDGAPGIVGLLVDLAEAVAGDDDALAFLGASPLEDLLRYHADEFIDEVDQAARRVPAFTRALRCAWFEYSLPAEQAARLRRFGPPL